MIAETAVTRSESEIIIRTVIVTGSPIGDAAIAEMIEDGDFGDIYMNVRACKCKLQSETVRIAWTNLIGLMPFRKRTPENSHPHLNLICYLFT